jgi:nicotinate-nucleotide adenylyltransferase
VQRLGLYGGSFNPVHLGHLLVGQAAREELGLTRLCYIPAAQSPFKPGVALAPAADRLRLLRLALAGQTGCELDDQEIRRGGVSYTIDTVRDYRKRFPDTELFCLVGADHAQLLPTWRAAEELSGLVEFVVIPRPGQGRVAVPPPFRARYLDGFPLGLSSSQIRDRIREGRPVDLLVGPAVAEALRNNRLYL